MAIDLIGIKNINEYYTNHYLSTIFEENISETIKNWNELSKEEGEKTPWSRLREAARQYYVMHDRSSRRSNNQIPALIQEMADIYLSTFGYQDAEPFELNLDDGNKAYIYREEKKQDGSPLLWIILSHNNTKDIKPLLNENSFNGDIIEESIKMTSLSNEELASKIFFNLEEAPRWLIVIGKDTIGLLDRNKWNEKRYLEFDLDEVFSRREESTLKAISVLLHKENLCPEEGSPLLDALDENSNKHASGVSQDLKYALRESIELLGNEVLYDMKHRQGINLEENPVEGEVLSIQCLRYMYRLLFLLFIEARPELGYIPENSQAYKKGYSLESLRDIAEAIREETAEVGQGYYLQETLSLLFNLVYNGYPISEEELKELKDMDSYHHLFILEPLKAHIFDPNRTPLLSKAKLRNATMLKIIDLMSITRPTGRRNDRRSRISYSNLGINQMGAAYETLLSYRGFIAKETLFEVKRARDQFNELDVGYFVPENQLDNYSEDERVRHSDGSLKKHERGEFIYRLAGREREKSASYYTPEVLTKTLVKYSLKELLEGKSADDILKLKICEPAMGSAAFLNEAINQLAEAYLDLKQKELGESIPHNEMLTELQKVKMYIADKNVYGIDLNPIAVELAEVSLWLNTIYEGAYVPWFSTQLVTGNSLIGARRECYRIEQLQTSSTGIRWYDNAPDRVPLGSKRMAKKQVYHFLAGDPGMANYNDRVIKSLAEENLKTMRDWKKKFTEPYTDDEIQNLQRLSKIIDELWEKQVELRKEVDRATSDELIVYGQDKGGVASHTTIREKDQIYKILYKSEEQRNAGPYARLRFAMDYWCSLWFWPIEKADLLPSRSEFIADMYLILEGTIDTFKGVNEQIKTGQLFMFPNEKEQLMIDISELYSGMGVVDIPKLCLQQPRLALVKKIAKEQKFMHWELEFADLFKENGGFDLILGNPPWIKTTWNEQSLLSDSNPMFVIKNLSATQTTKHRTEAIDKKEIKKLYFSEYESLSGIQNFLNSTQNYSELKGQQTNLYKCFLPLGLNFATEAGVFAYVHPNGIFDDPNGGRLREKIYPKLKRHYQFQNEKKLFSEVANRMIFSLTVYSNNGRLGFDSISNLFLPATIDECYDSPGNQAVGGIKDSSGNWNVVGHPDRIIYINKEKLEIFAKVFDGNDNWKQARLPVLQSSQLADVLNCFMQQKMKLEDLSDDILTTVMWDETYAQRDGIIKRKEHFAESLHDIVYSGPHIGLANPVFQSSKRICDTHRAYDGVDLTCIPEDYTQRTNYLPASNINEYMRKVPNSLWGDKYTNHYRVLSRKMLSLAGERTLVSAIIPPHTGHILTTFGIACKDINTMTLLAGTFISIPFDFVIKVLNNASFLLNTAKILPICDKYIENIVVRALLLNCISNNYTDLWKGCWDETYKKDGWSKIDGRLSTKKFSALTKEWTWDTPLRTDYERRQALVEIDVLTAMALGLTLEQLKTIYRIQFPVLQQYEADTWYDQNGRIIFTNNRSLTGVGFKRPEFNEIKEAKAGEVFTQTIMDDTMPDGPIERTIEYVAPFDKCDREEDYETAWKYFEEKYKNNPKK